MFSKNTCKNITYYVLIINHIICEGFNQTNSLAFTEQVYFHFEPSDQQILNSKIQEKKELLTVQIQKTFLKETLSSMRSLPSDSYAMLFCSSSLLEKVFFFFTL